MNLTPVFSTFPNDTYIFDTMIHEKVDTEGAQFYIEMPNSISSDQFIKNYSPELNDYLIQMHINLYVNNFTVDLGEIGKDAVKNLDNRVVKEAIIKIISQNIFVD